MGIAINFAFGLLALCASATSAPAQAARVIYAYDEPGRGSLVALTSGYIEDRNRVVSSVFCYLGEDRCTEAQLFQGSNPGFSFAGVNMEVHRPGLGSSGASIPVIGASLTRPGTYTNVSSNARLTIIELADSDVIYAYDEPGRGSLIAITSGYIEDGNRVVSPVFCYLGENRCTEAQLFQGSNPGFSFAGVSMEVHGPGVSSSGASIPIIGASLTRPDVYTNPGSDARLVVIGPVTAAVPEPETWTLLICGFGLVGGAMRSKRRDSRQDRRHQAGDIRLTP